MTQTSKKEEPIVQDINNGTSTGGPSGSQPQPQPAVQDPKAQKPVGAPGGKPKNEETKQKLNIFYDNLLKNKTKTGGAGGEPQKSVQKQTSGGVQETEQKQPSSDI